jgi:hypothetical protein
MQSHFRIFPSVCCNRLLNLAFVAITFLPAVASAQQFEEHDGIFVRKGYKYAPGKTRYDTISVLDPVTGEVMFLPHADYSQAASINGNKIYSLNEVTSPASISTGQELTEVSMLQSLREYIGQLYFQRPDSISVRINLKNIVVDENGAIVYFELGGVRAVINGLIRDLDTGELPQRISKIIGEMPPLKPATLNGKNVMSYADINLHRFRISSAGKSISWVNDGSTYRE